jgi:transcriptional regulator with XRE-family HTH domain
VTHTALGLRLARYRKSNGLSAAELAELAGTTRSVIANIESGRRTDMSTDELVKLSAALGIPPFALLFPVDRPFENVTLGEFVMPVELARKWFVGELPLASGEAGSKARRLIQVGSGLYRARGMVTERRRDVMRLAASYGFDTAEVASAINAGDFAESTVAARLIAHIEEQYPSVAESARAEIARMTTEEQTYASIKSAFESIEGNAPELPVAGPDDWQD